MKLVLSVESVFSCLCCLTVSVLSVDCQEMTSLGLDYDEPYDTSDPLLTSDDDDDIEEDTEEVIHSWKIMNV